jgi:hypothetical protein
MIEHIGYADAGDDAEQGGDASGVRRRHDADLAFLQSLLTANRTLCADYLAFYQRHNARRSV